MFGQEDHTYQDIRKKSLLQWLDEMEQHEDITVRGGVALAKGYIASLEEEKRRLESENKKTKEYLKQVAMKLREKK